MENHKEDARSYSQSCRLQRLLHYLCKKNQVTFDRILKLRFHENSSNHPKDFTSLFWGENSFLVFHLAFISYEKLFEYTAMHLATWKPDFTGGCKQRVNCYQIARHVSPDTIQTSPNIRFLGGFIFEKYLSITFLDVVVQTRYLYSTCKYLLLESLITNQNIAKYNVI